MTVDSLARLWFWGGLVLMFAELLVPGLIVVFLGAAAVTVGVVTHYGLTPAWHQQLLLWFVLSLSMVFSIRGFFQRLLPGETERGSTDEDADVFGKVVLVTQPCGTTTSSAGRIRLHGVEWDAVCAARPLPAGSSAVIRGRDNLIWLVEPAATGAEAPDHKDDQHGSAAVSGRSHHPS